MLGKTSLGMVLCGRQFPYEYIPTVFDNTVLSHTFNDRPVTVHLWDTAGPEDYDRLRPLSYPNTNLFLIMFSMVYPSSLDNVSKKWVPEVKLHCPNTPILLVGTKQDLVGDGKIIRKLEQMGQHVVTREEAEQKARECGCVSFVETSAMSGVGVVGLVEGLVKVVAVASEMRVEDGVSSKKKKECIMQ